MEKDNRDKMESSNVGSESMAYSIDLNKTPVSSPGGGDDDWISRAAETSVSVCSVCRREVPAQRGAAPHPGWKCLRCLLESAGQCSSEGGRRLERFDINASPPREDDVDVVAVASRNDHSCEASTSFHPFPPSRERVQQKSGIITDRDPCPPGKLLSSSLPAYLMGDALQVWELALRFSEVLGLGQPFSFQELVSELVSPWPGSYLDSHLGSAMDTILAKIHGSLLKLLVSELLSKVAASACPDIDNRESKSRRGKEKDSNCLAALKKTRLGMLPVNGLTRHEIARRYIIALMSMKGDLEPTEIASRVSGGKVFHCLHGDGGILCGSLTGIAALEGDAVVLEDAMNAVFGSLQTKDEILGVCERESDTDGAQATEAGNDAIPEWAQLLEPVRLLRTNIGARIKKCIFKALERNPPEWAKEILEHSISKDVYKANASGPTKRAVISVLEMLNSDNLRQKHEMMPKIRSTSDLINKQCRIVLRRAMAADEARVFCTLVGRTILSPNDNVDEGLLGYPAMVSRPLDFRTIDVRLAAGAYGGSHEAFIEDVREVWRNIRTAYGNCSDLVGLAENLSEKFEELYEREVLSLVNKVARWSSANGLNDDAVKERDDLLALVIKNPLPRAPWDEGICKVCGMDKDEDKVLLCDKCNSEYHRYCLNPPLQKIPKGDWYCPSCVAGQSIRWGDTSGSVATQCAKRRKHGELTGKSFDDLAQLATLLEFKECWDFTVEERMFLLKFLFEEALNSATIRDHLEKSAPRTIELQHKLQSLTSELKLLKFKEEMLVSDKAQANSGVGNASSSLVPDQADMQDNSLKLVPIKKEICDLQDSIASIESELLKVSPRKDLLGRDSNGRAYWAFYSPGARPWIVANGSLTFQEPAPEEFPGIAVSDQWISYESDNEIRQLLEWLTEDNDGEKKLRESILQLQLRLKDEYHENHLLSEAEPNHLRFADGGRDISADFLTTKAMTVLEKRTGLCLGTESTDVGESSTSTVNQEEKMYRCGCLELLWPAKYHCLSCHQSFPTIEQLRQHAAAHCRPLETVEHEKPPGAEDGSTEQDKVSVFGVSKSSIINEASLKPLTGIASKVLRFLKINLLDMDAALPEDALRISRSHQDRRPLPEDALRISRSHQDRRHAWRSFVKSAASIYEMVQATIVFEDTIKSEYLHSDWGYWSSPSTAAKITTTLCALALRIYMLDSAISYEKPFPSGVTEPAPIRRPVDIPETSRRAGKRKKISKS